MLTSLSCRETRLSGGKTLGGSLRLLGELNADVERLVADQDIRGSHVHLKGLPCIMKEYLAQDKYPIVKLDSRDGFCIQVDIPGARTTPNYERSVGEMRRC